MQQVFYDRDLFLYIANSTSNVFDLLTMNGVDKILRKWYREIPQVIKYFDYVIEMASENRILGFKDKNRSAILQKYIVTDNLSHTIAFSELLQKTILFKGFYYDMNLDLQMDIDGDGKIDEICVCLKTCTKMGIEYEWIATLIFCDSGDNLTMNMLGDCNNIFFYVSEILKMNVESFSKIKNLSSDNWHGMKTEILL